MTIENFKPQENFNYSKYIDKQERKDNKYKKEITQTIMFFPDL